MAEVLVEFDTVVRDRNGVEWVPRVCGAVADDGLWEGWIEYTPTDTSAEPIRTPRETGQPNRADLMYWAQGLTQLYLESALDRALKAPRLPRRSVSAAWPHFDSPAPRVPARPPLPHPRPVLNPFEVYAQGEHVLRKELSALAVTRLRDIVVGYGLGAANGIEQMDRDELTEMILAGVRRPGTGRTSTSRDATL